MDSKEDGIHIVVIKTLPLFDKNIAGNNFEEKFTNLIESLFCNEDEGLVALVHNKLKKLKESNV